MAEPIPDLLKTPEDSLHPIRHVAAFLGRTPFAVRGIIRRGNLATVMEGHIHYIRTGDLKAYIERRRLFKSERKNHAHGKP